MEKIKKSIFKKVNKAFDTNLTTKVTDIFRDVDNNSVKVHNNNGVYEELNDEKVIIRTGSKISIYIMGSLTFFFAIISYFVNQEINLYLIPSVISMLLFLYAFTIPSKKIILDRKKQLITLPGNFYYKSYTFPFNEAQANWSSIVGGGGPQFMLAIKKRGNSTGFIVNAHVKLYYEIWSLYVWYMDKNRPLPPGEAFDSYRQKDYERRKSEGFPKPLYPSNIPTPEATKEQQVERKQIGRW